jgi:hypothetical protein
MEDLQGLVGTVVVVSFIGVLVWMRRHFAERRKRNVQETIRTAIMHGQTLTPETVRAIALGEDEVRADLRRGILLIAVALGLLAFSLISILLPNEGGPPENIDWMIALSACFPAFLGAAYLFLYFTRPDDLD